MRPIDVVVLCRYGRQAASSRLRVWDLLPGLAEGGIRTTVEPLFDDEYVRARHTTGRTGVWRHGVRRLAALVRPRACDLLWIETEVLPWLPWIIEGSLLRRSPYVLDVSEAWFARYREHPNVLVRGLLGGKLDALARGARLTIAGNGAIEAWARSAGAQRVVRLATSIPLERYRPVAPRGDSGTFTIGWIGSPSTAAYLRPIASLMTAMTSQGLVDVTLVGAGGVDLGELHATRVPWTEQTECGLLAGFDVGLAPLADTAWCRSKSAYKVLQYMASGLPVVASPIGMNVELIDHGHNGFLASGPEQWRQALDVLRLDRTLCRQMGERGRRLVEAQYSRETALRRLAAVLREAAGELA